MTTCIQTGDIVRVTVEGAAERRPVIDGVLVWLREGQDCGEYFNVDNAPFLVLSTSPNPYDKDSEIFKVHLLSSDGRTGWTWSTNLVRIA